MACCVKEGERSGKKIYFWSKLVSNAILFPQHKKYKSIYDFVQAQYSGDQEKVAALVVEMANWKPNDKEMDCLVNCAPAEQQCALRCVTKHKFEVMTCGVESSACYNCLDECSDGTVSELMVAYGAAQQNTSPEQKKCGLKCLPTKFQCNAMCVDEHISDKSDQSEANKCILEESSGCFKCILDECVNGAGTVGVTSFTILFSLAFAAFRM